MAGFSGISAYQQSNQINKGSERTYESTSSKIVSSSSSKEGQASKIETKGFTPINSKSSLVPKTTEYGNAIGDAKLSDKAKGGMIMFVLRKFILNDAESCTERKQSNN